MIFPDDFYIFFEGHDFTYYIANEQNTKNNTRTIVVYYPRANRYIWGELDAYLYSRLKSPQQSSSI